MIPIQGLAREMDSCRERVQELTRLIEDADPVLAKSPEVVQVISFIKRTASRPTIVTTELLDPCDKLSYADIAAGRVSPCPFSDTPADKRTETPTQLVVTKPLVTKPMVVKSMEDDMMAKEPITTKSEVVEIETSPKGTNIEPMFKETGDKTEDKTQRRGRSPFRREAPRDNQKAATKLPPKPIPVESKLKQTKPHDDLGKLKSEDHAKALAQRLLAPESVRGRSPSPLFIPGESASYAQMVRSGSRPQSRSVTPDRIKESLTVLNVKALEQPKSQIKNENKHVEENSNNELEVGCIPPSVNEPVITENEKLTSSPKVQKKINPETNKETASEKLKTPTKGEKTADSKASKGDKHIPAKGDKRPGIKEDSKKQKPSGPKPLAEKKIETAVLPKELKPKSQSKSKVEKKQALNPLPPIEQVVPPILPIQSEIQISDYQGLAPELQYSTTAFTDTQGGLHYPPGLFPSYIGPEGEVASFIASGQQLISSGLGTYTTSQSYCEQPLFVGESYNVSSGIYNIQQTAEYPPQVFVSDPQSYMSSFGGSHAAYTHIESDPLALEANNETGVSYASILAQGLSAEPHLSQSRLQMQTETQQWSVSPACDGNIITDSVERVRDSKDRDEISMKGMKRSKSPLLRNENRNTGSEIDSSADQFVSVSTSEPKVSEIKESDDVNTGKVHSVSESLKTNKSQPKTKKQKGKGSSQVLEQHDKLDKTSKQINQDNKTSGGSKKAKLSKTEEKGVSLVDNEQPSDTIKSENEIPLSSNAGNVGSIEDNNKDMVISSETETNTKDQNEFQISRKGKKKMKAAHSSIQASVQQPKTTTAKSENIVHLTEETVCDKNIETLVDNNSDESRSKHLDKNIKAEPKTDSEPGRSLVEKINQKEDGKIEHTTKSKKKGKKASGKDKSEEVPHKTDPKIDIQSAEASAFENSQKLDDNIESTTKSKKKGKKAVVSEKEKNEEMPLQRDENNDISKPNEQETLQRESEMDTDAVQPSSSNKKKQPKKNKEKTVDVELSTITDVVKDKINTDISKEKDTSKLMQDNSTKKKGKHSNDNCNKALSSNDVLINETTQDSEKSKESHLRDQPKDISHDEQNKSEQTGKKKKKKTIHDSTLKNAVETVTVNPITADENIITSISTEKLDSSHKENVSQKKKKPKEVMMKSEDNLSSSLKSFVDSETLVGEKIKKPNDKENVCGPTRPKDKSNELIEANSTSLTVDDKSEPDKKKSKKNKVSVKEHKTDSDSTLTKPVVVESSELQNNSVQEVLTKEIPNSQMHINNQKKQNIEKNPQDCHKNSETENQPGKKKKNKASKNKINNSELVEKSDENKLSSWDQTLELQESPSTNKDLETIQQTKDNTSHSSSRKGKNKSKGKGRAELDTKEEHPPKQISYQTDNSCTAIKNTAVCTVTSSETELILKDTPESVSEAPAAESIQQNIGNEEPKIVQPNALTEKPVNLSENVKKKDCAPEKDTVTQHVSEEQQSLFESESNIIAKDDITLETINKTSKIIDTGNTVDDGKPVLSDSCIETLPIDKIADQNLFCSSEEIKYENNDYKSISQDLNTSNVAMDKKSTGVKTIDSSKEVQKLDNVPSDKMKIIGEKPIKTSNEIQQLAVDIVAVDSDKEITDSDHKDTTTENNQTNAIDIPADTKFDSVQDDGQSFSNIMVDIISKLDEAILKADAEIKQKENLSDHVEASAPDQKALEVQQVPLETSIEETPDGFKSEIKFSVESCDNTGATKQSHTEKGEKEPIHQNTSSKPLARRSSKKAKPREQIKKETTSLPKSIIEGPGEQQTDTYLVADHTTASKSSVEIKSFKDYSPILEINQNPVNQSFVTEPTKSIERDVTPKAQKLDDLETVKITKLPVSSFKQTEETVNKVTVEDSANQVTQVESDIHVCKNPSESDLIKPILDSESSNKDIGSTKTNDYVISQTDFTTVESNITSYTKDDKTNKSLEGSKDIVEKAFEINDSKMTALNYDTQLQSTEELLSEGKNDNPVSQAQVIESIDLELQKQPDSLITDRKVTVLQGNDSEMVSTPQSISSDSHKLPCYNEENQKKSAEQVVKEKSKSKKHDSKQKNKSKQIVSLEENPSKPTFPENVSVGTKSNVSRKEGVKPAPKQHHEDQLTVEKSKGKNYKKGNKVSIDKAEGNKSQVSTGEKESSLVACISGDTNENVIRKEPEISAEAHLTDQNPKKTLISESKVEVKVEHVSSTASALDSPPIVEIELDEKTTLNEITEDVIKPFLKRSSPTSFTFENDDTFVVQDKHDVFNQSKEEKISVSSETTHTVETENTGKSTDQGHQAMACDVGTDNKSKQPKKASNLSKSHEDLPNKKKKSSEPGKQKKQHGKPSVQKTDSQHSIDRVEVKERTKSKSPEKQDPIFSPLSFIPKREKSPLLALAPPWMAKLVQGEQSDMSSINENPGTVVSNDLADKEQPTKEAKIASEAIEIGIFGSVKERSKHVSIQEEKTLENETPKTKQKKKDKSQHEGKVKLESTNLQQQTDTEIIPLGLSPTSVSTTLHISSNEKSPLSDLPETLKPDKNELSEKLEIKDTITEQVSLKLQTEKDNKEKTFDPVSLQESPKTSKRNKSKRKQEKANDSPSTENIIIIPNCSKKRPRKTKNSENPVTTDKTLVQEIIIEKENLAKSEQKDDNFESQTESNKFEERDSIPKDEITQKVLDDSPKTESENLNISESNDQNIDKPDKLSASSIEKEIPLEEKGVLNTQEGSINASSQIDSTDSENKEDKTDMKVILGEQSGDVSSENQIIGYLELVTPKTGAYKSHAVELSKKSDNKTCNGSSSETLNECKPDNKIEKENTFLATTNESGFEDKQSTTVKTTKECDISENKITLYELENTDKSFVKETLESPKGETIDISKTLNFNLEKMGTSQSFKTEKEEIIHTRNNVKDDDQQNTCDMDKSQKVATNTNNTIIENVVLKETDNIEIQDFVPDSEIKSGLSDTNKTQEVCLETLEDKAKPEKADFLEKEPKHSTKSSTSTTSPENVKFELDPQDLCAGESGIKSKFDLVVGSEVGILTAPTPKSEINVKQKKQTISGQHKLPQSSHKEQSAILTEELYIPRDSFGIESVKENEVVTNNPVINVHQEPFYCEVPKFSLYEIESAERHWHENKNSGLDELSQENEESIKNKEDSNKTELEIKTSIEIVEKNFIEQTQAAKSWADIAATEKIIKEENTEDIDKQFEIPSQKPLPVVICVNEAENNLPLSDNMVSVDPEGFMEFVPKKEIRKRKSRSRSRNRSESEQQSSESFVKKVPTYASTELTVSGSDTTKVGTATAFETEIPLSPKLDLSETVKTDSVPKGENIKLITSKESKIQEPPKVSSKQVQLLSVKKDHTKSRSRSRSRNRNISESEKEVDEILRAWSREEVFQQNIPLDGTFWTDKWKYDDAERSFYESISNGRNKYTEEYDMNLKRGGDNNDDDDKGPNSGPSSPGPKSTDGKDGPSNKPDSVLETLTADLPHGVGAWSDASTYLSRKVPPREKSPMVITSQFTKLTKVRQV
ncbi:hypothetical protein J6590_025979 [Homalodisca vitripennis]|nr:hypothetical protein J6590_025979 [Homalodisca vitripennis]